MKISCNGGVYLDLRLALATRRKTKTFIENQLNVSTRIVRNY